MTSDTFIAGRGPLYRIDPRAKVLFLVAMTIWFFLPVTLGSLWVVVGILFVVMVGSIGVKYSRRVIASISAMLLFMVLFMPFSQRTGEGCLSIRGWTVVTWAGLWQTLLLMGRFMGITFTCTLLFATTKMHDITLVLLSWHLPYKVALVVTLAFTYIPFIGDSFKEIQESHKLRRPNVCSGKSHLKDMLPTLTSALVVSLRSIPFLAMSLEQRGYGRRGRRTRYHDFSQYRHGVLSCVLVVTGVIVLFLVCRM